MTYKEFLESLKEDKQNNTKDEVGLILYHRDSVLLVNDGQIWTIPIGKIKLLESKENAVSRIFNELFEIDIDQTKFNLVSVKFNSDRGKLYLYTYNCRSNYQTNGFVEEHYIESRWNDTENLPRPFCETTIEYINN